jgi:opacity protein-like surface antigen
MQRLFRSIAQALVAGALAAAACGAAAEGTPPLYSLTTPAPMLDPEVAPRQALLVYGPLQLSSASSMTGSGSGLSLQAGSQWFARVGMGHSLENSDVLSLGGGYRFTSGQAVSMHVTRQLGQERLGLAVRYDWTRTYLRLAYESPTRATAGPDTLRFSAGVRF